MTIHNMRALPLIIVLISLSLGALSVHQTRPRHRHGRARSESCGTVGSPGPAPCQVTSFADRNVRVGLGARDVEPEPYSLGVVTFAPRGTGLIYITAPSDLVVVKELQTDPSALRCVSTSTTTWICSPVAATDAPVHVSLFFHAPFPDEDGDAVFRAQRGSCVATETVRVLRPGLCRGLARCSFTGPTYPTWDAFCKATDCATIDDAVVLVQGQQDIEVDFLHIINGGKLVVSDASIPDPSNPPVINLYAQSILIEKDSALVAGSRANPLQTRLNIQLYGDESRAPISCKTSPICGVDADMWVADWNKTNADGIRYGNPSLTEGNTVHYWKGLARFVVFYLFFRTTSTPTMSLRLPSTIPTPMAKRLSLPACSPPSPCPSCATMACLAGRPWPLHMAVPWPFMGRGGCLPPRCTSIPPGAPSAPRCTPRTPPSRSAASMKTGWTTGIPSLNTGLLLACASASSLQAQAKP